MFLYYLTPLFSSIIPTFMKPFFATDSNIYTIMTFLLVITRKESIMIPVNPQYFKGISFIQIGDLPESQKQQLMLWLPDMEKIKIKKGEYYIDNCITYKVYTFWFHNHYSIDRTFEDQI